VNFNNYETAKSLYGQWELLDREANSYQEEVESNARKIAKLPSDSDKETVMLSQAAVNLISDNRSL
jgi:hypothetical protein